MLSDSPADNIRETELIPAEKLPNGKPKNLISKKWSSLRAH